MGLRQPHFYICACSCVSACSREKHSSIVIYSTLASTIDREGAGMENKYYKHIKPLSNIFARAFLCFIDYGGGGGGDGGWVGLFCFLVYTQNTTTVRRIQMCTFTYVSCCCKLKAFNSQFDNIRKLNVIMVCASAPLVCLCVCFHTADKHNVTCLVQEY